MKNKIKKQIGVVGLWHLGSVHTACLANMGFDVTAYDSNEKVIENFKSGKPPIFEPGIEEMIADKRSSIHFTDNPQIAIKDKKYVFITQDVSINNKDQVQMDTFWELAGLVCDHCSDGTVIVVSSQVPVTSCRKLQNILNDLNKKCTVLCIPENLRLGTAVDNFLKPDRIVMGSDSNEVMTNFQKDFADFRCEFLSMSLESAEMSKHAMNAYLALNISFSSEIGDICELVGADLRDVVRSLKSDRRVSPKAPLNPGMGYAGGTLGRDLESLKSVSKNYNYNPQLIKSISKVNRDRIKQLIKKTISVLGTVKNARIGILGLTYKPNTNTLRRSLSIMLIKRLLALGANIVATDPMIDQLDINKGVILENDPEAFFSGTDVVILMTEWPDFQNIFTEDRIKSMKRPNVIDAKNFLDGQKISSMNCNYISVGYSL